MVAMTTFLLAVLLAQIAAQKAPQPPPPPHSGQQDVDVEKDVTYGPAADEVRWKLDVYRPKDAKGNRQRAAIIFFHGGGFRAGSKAQFAWYAADAASLGYVAFSATYRLAPKDLYPAAVDDAQRVVRWVRANAAKYGVDRKRIGAVGSSAGRHLVAMLAARETRDNSDAELARFSSRVTCAVDYFGPVSFREMPGPAKESKGPVYGFLGKSAAEAPELWAEASPLTHVSAQSVPVLAIHGTADTSVPIGQSEMLVEKLKQSGVHAELLRVEGAPHGFHNRLASEDAQRAWKAALEFLNRCLK